MKHENLASILEANTGGETNTAIDRATIAYLFRLIPVSEFNSKIQKRYRLTPTETIDLRAAINGNGYLQQSLKPYLFWYWHKDPTDERMEYMAGRYGVHANDIELVDHLRYRLIAENMKTLAGFKPYTRNKMDRTLARIPNELKGWTSNQVWRSMRFLFNNNNGIDPDDCASDCIGRGVYSFLNTYPRIINPLHAINVSKRGITHHIGKMIEHYTTAKRATMLKIDGKYVHLFDNHPIEDHVDLGKEYIDENSTLIVTNTAVRFAGMEREAVMAMAGIKSGSFSDWLHANAYDGHKMDNDALYDFIMETEDSIDVYTDYIMDYMGLHWTQWDAFKKRVIDTMHKKPAVELI